MINSVRYQGKYLFVGGLGVTGNLHEIDNAEAITAMAMNNGFETIILPASNIRNHGFVCADKIFPDSNLRALIKYLSLRTRHNRVKLPYALLSDLNFN